MDINFYQIFILIVWFGSILGLAWLIIQGYFKFAAAAFVLMVLLFAANPVKFTTDSVRSLEAIKAPTTSPIPPRVTVDTPDYKAEQQKHLSTIRNQSDEVYNEITE